MRTRSGVRATQRLVSGEQRRYWNSREEARLGYKLESATEFQEQAESNRIRPQAEGADNHSAIILSLVVL